MIECEIASPAAIMLRAMCMLWNGSQFDMLLQWNGMEWNGMEWNGRLPLSAQVVQCTGMKWE